MGNKGTKKREIDKKAMTRQVIFYFILVISLIFILNSVSVIAKLSLQSLDLQSGFLKTKSETNCWSYNGNLSGCSALSNCFWVNNSAAPLQDVWCKFNYTSYNTTDFSNMWVGGFNQSFINITGGDIANAGCCYENWASNGSSSGGGSIKGCWNYNGINESACENSLEVTGCEWKPNNANQNPGCGNNVGCCEKQGCWDFGGDQSLLGDNNCTAVFNGICSYVNKTENPFCPDAIGCCEPKRCGEVDTANACNQLTQLDMPCTWNGTDCREPSGSGFGFFNDFDSCVNKGGWWNASGQCQMPEGASGGSGGGGGFMFAQEARCWFADNKPSICGNVSGCVYCNNLTTQINNASSACYNGFGGWCQGHDLKFTNWNGSDSINITDINTSSMSCSDIQLKQICSCGPLPNCKWTNSSAVIGSYCTIGIKSNDEVQNCQAPVSFCEDPQAKNNYTLCTDLAEKYMMPCKWDNTSSVVKNCTFNTQAVFGGSAGGPGGMDYNLIGSESSCIAAGGSWESSYYVDEDGVFKQDGWCDKGAMFSFSSGQASANKGNCDSDCWACEFNSTGGTWSNNNTAAANCTASAKGVCIWKDDANAQNGQGWCDYPKEMDFGGNQECSSDCKACEFYGSPEQECSNSPAQCNWINDTNALKGGFCISKTKKSCSTDCFSCYQQEQCSNSTFHAGLNCSWENNLNFCKPSGFTGEVCFNGKDDDNDNMIDCGDSDCGFDQFCGGANLGTGSSGGDNCKLLFTEGNCNIGQAGNGRNCTWVTPTWGGEGYCDFPGANCWTLENNRDACTIDKGCLWKNETGSYTNTTVAPDETKKFFGFCEINKTLAESCFQAFNESSCGELGNCSWRNDSFSFSGGFCDFKLFGGCADARNSSACSAALGGSSCSWRNDSFSHSGGFCEPICFGLDSSCTDAPAGLCEARSAVCEAEMFSFGSGGGGGSQGCHAYDSNQTACVAQNISCTWKSFSGEGGICESKGESAMFEGMDQSPPKILGADVNDTLQVEVDIREFGVKDMDDSLAFGIMVTNITNSAVCRGYQIGHMGPPEGGQFLSPIDGNGSATSKFYWFLDTDKNQSNGCNATSQTGQNLTGFDFLMKYVVSLSNGSASETKSFYKCSSGSWMLTNVPLSSNRQFMCGMRIPSFGASMPGMIGGVMIVVDKENLESFSEYNKSASLRVFVSSANGSDSYNKNNPLDSASEAGYYTHGSADFKFVDCSNPNTKDTKCKNFQKFGFNIFEDCKNGVDDDGDGASDCSDMKCTFTPVCAGAGSAFNFEANANDTSSPIVMFSQVDTMPDGAFIRFDTNEPANGTVTFYHNDSSCLSANTSIDDIGDPAMTFDDYKPFHMVSIDEFSLNYALSNGTSYYYKTSNCDPSNNCAVSACQNFTTKSDAAHKNFIFKMKLPAGFNVTIPALNYSGNFTYSVPGTNKSYDVGIKTNSSISRNINVTVNCGNQSLTFVGVDILKPKNIDMENAFICDEGNNVLGMNSTTKAWNQLVTDLSLGGKSDHIQLTFPIDYAAGNNITWCDDSLSNCTNVNDYANCSDGGSSKTNCKVPTSLGFSVYQVTTSDSSPAGGDTPAGGGGGGGGGATTPVVNHTNTTNATGGEVIYRDEGVDATGAGEDGADESGTSEEIDSDLEKESSNAWMVWTVIAIVVVIVVVGVALITRRKN